MKNILSLFLIIALFVFFVPPDLTNAQTEKRVTFKDIGNNILIEQTIGTAADPMDTLTSYDSQEFSLSSYDYYFTGTYQKSFVSASLKPRVTTTIQGSFDLTNWFAVDTLGIVSDSVETVQSGTITNLPLKTYPYYQILNTYETGQPGDVIASVKCYFTKPNIAVPAR